MKSLLLRGLVLLVCLVVAQGQNAGGPRPTQSIQSSASGQTATPRALVDQYCVTCHNQRAKIGGLALDSVDMTKVSQNSEVLEKVVRKLRAGMMPPQGSPRPDAATYESLTVSLENDLDRAAAANPKLPSPGVHRMNRTEYANAIRELLSLDIDPSIYLPADDTSYGFDNVMSGLQISPALVEGYVSAASKLSRLALGHETAQGRKIYYVREDHSQEDHLEGLPFGTRGGILANHYFPADGEYMISWVPVRNTVGTLYGGDAPNEKVELTIDGARIKLYEVGKDIALSQNVQADKNEVRIPVKAGQHAVGISFIANTYVPQIFLNRSYRRSILDGNPIEGIMQTPQISQMTIQGPVNGVRPAELPSRKKIMTCKPASATEELACAKTILSNLARRAYRRPLTDTDSSTLVGFYRSGREGGGTFEDGIERGLQFVLTHPEFLFRTENVPASIKVGESYRISDLELASRLSFFLWSNLPDDELITLAGQGKLKDPQVLELQVKRMLLDPRAKELVNNFAGQWLGLRTMQTSTPEGTIYPDFDDNLRQAMRTETEMFFESILKENRSIVELLTADYTFVNERLAAHYGIPNVYGNQFRRVKLDGDLDVRRGLLGKGSVHLVTSNGTAPVLRGKWVLEKLLGTHPPDPPPNVPALKPNPTAGQQTLRQRLEEHRANPACASCHKMMDPIGFSLENFDATGKWRSREVGHDINATGVLVDGSQLNGVVSLREALVRYSPQFVRTFTEKLLTYALGRGVDYEDMPMVRSIVSAAGKNDYKFSSIVLEIVKSQPFQMNRKADTVDVARSRQ